MDNATQSFIIQSINFLQMATDQYGKISYDSRIEIDEIIERLEFILQREGE